MNTYKSGNRAYRQARSLVIALGNFDGVHVGHAELLKAAVDEADKLEADSAVWTFERRKDINTPYLTDKDEKIKIFGSYGIDYVMFEEFDSVRTMKPEDFVRDILVSKLNCVKAVCGFNFRFGFMGTGDSNTLSSLIDTVIVPPVEIYGEPVSSTRIRSAIESGNMMLARKMLGRGYSIILKVIGGNRLGRTIGVPTINQIFPNGKAIPKNGVYITRTVIENKVYRSITNIGTRPTVSGSSEHIICETHIINFDGDLYGKNICVEFCDYRRNERKFDSLDELKNVIALDIKAAWEYNYV